ncbi:MAG: hypothetical protein E7570_02385 [Ruminococcaceae bacterium]|nr:hypothetical protein [Oscillospiraceae bacterium]
MKKSIKNTIMIGMAAVLIGTSAVTISYAKGSRSMQMPNPPSQSQQFDGQQSGEQFGKFEQDNQQNNGFSQHQKPGNQQNGSSSQQPQMPNNQGENSSQEQAPNNQNDSAQTPDNSQNSSENSSSSAKNTSLSVEALAAEDGNLQAVDESAAKKSLPSSSFSRNGSIVPALCYMFAAVQIAIILSIIAYLIISKMNRISFNEVLANMRKTSKEQVENQ